MPTSKQRPTSRAHSKNSTAPRIPEGQAESPSAVQESAADLAQITTELHQKYRPADIAEQFLVETLIHNQWRLNRLRGIEASFGTNASGDPAAPAALKRLQQVVRWTERNYQRALKQLKAGRAHSRQATDRADGPQPIEAFDASFQSICTQ
jgi:hypothetical protein